MTQHMKSARFGTRWGRAALVFAPAVGVAGVLGVTVVQSSLAASYSSSSSPATLVAPGLTSEDIGIVVRPLIVKDADGNESSLAQARIGLKNASISELCIVQDMQMLGRTFTLYIEAPGPISVDGVVIDTNVVAASIGLTGDAAINKSASEVSVGALNLDAASDQIGIQASGAQLSGAKLKAYDLIVPGVLSAPGLQLGLADGGKSC